jgi:hypothetical protein
MFFGPLSPARARLHAPSASRRQKCAQVALASTWGFFDAPHPNVYVYTKV